MQPKPVTRGKLTKRLLMSLDTGQYVVSSAYEPVDGADSRPASERSWCPRCPE
jgi:hypothetical protein